MMSKASAVNDVPLRILFAAPVWAPSRAFGGPVVAAGELVRRLVAHGHTVEVLTTTITDLGTPPAIRSTTGIVDGATVHYLATLLRYRWMGITPTLPIALARSQRPDVAHVFGFRDPVTTVLRRGAGSRACRTCSSRSGCSSRGSGRCF